MAGPCSGKRRDTGLVRCKREGEGEMGNYGKGEGADK